MKGDKNGNLNKNVFEKKIKDADENGDGEFRLMSSKLLCLSFLVKVFF